jgi:hypothetical protein
MVQLMIRNHRRLEFRNLAGVDVSCFGTLAAWKCVENLPSPMFTTGVGIAPGPPRAQSKAPRTIFDALRGVEHGRGL